MSTAYKTLGWIFVVASLAAISAIAVVVSASQDDERFKNATPVVATAGTFLSLGTLLLKLGDDSKASRKNRSKFYLEASLAAYEEADKQLRNGNNERVRWIQASRMLAHAKNLSGSVEDEKHRLLLEVHLLKYREVFSRYCTSHPAAFFYGVTDWSSLSLDNAAIASRRDEMRGDVQTFFSTEIAEEAIRAVWDASQFPTEYDDPIGKRFDEAGMVKLKLHAPMIYQFLEHRHRRRNQ